MRMMAGEAMPDQGADAGEGGEAAEEGAEPREVGSDPHLHHGAWCMVSWCHGVSGAPTPDLRPLLSIRYVAMRQVGTPAA